MSRATRSAICSRSSDSWVASCSHHALHENAGRHDGLGIEFAQRHHFRHLGDGALCRHRHQRPEVARGLAVDEVAPAVATVGLRSEEHTSELQSLMRISYAVFCLKNKRTRTRNDIKQHLTK